MLCAFVVAVVGLGVGGWVVEVGAVCVSVSVVLWCVGGGGGWVGGFCVGVCVRVVCVVGCVSGREKVGEWEEGR